jgi:hypothetical protein
LVSLADVMASVASVLRDDDDHRGGSLGDQLASDRAGKAVAEFGGSSDNYLAGVGGVGDAQKLCGGVPASVDERVIKIKASARAYICP